MKRKIIIISILVIITSLCIATVSNAAIQIKSGTTAHTDVTVSNSFQYCYDMRHPTSSLGNNSLDPHLSLNRDWGATVYLGLSGYGTVRSANGSSTTINGTSYTTTTGNASGVFDMGKNYTQTSSIIEGTTNSGYITNLYQNKNSRYVEILSSTNDVANTKGQAFAETSGWYSSAKKYPATSKPVSIRNSILGYGYNSTLEFGTGVNFSLITYRPAIWN